MGELSEVLKEEIVGEMSRVAAVEISSAKELFGDSARNPTRMMVKVTCDNGANEVTALPKGVVYDGTAWHVEDHKAASRSLHNPKSKLGMWLRKYGDEPTVGQEVSTSMDDQGFMRIDL